MNADDMSKPVLDFGSFYRPDVLSKAVPFHTTSSTTGDTPESPANSGLLQCAVKIRIVQFS
jgi:hypothetical protein